MAKRPLVSIIDDDDSVREALPDLLSELGFSARSFSGAEQFLTSSYVDETDCLLLDFTMPGMTGPDLVSELARSGRQIPVIFITANEDLSVRHRLLQLGAVDCLIKPFSDLALRDALARAVQRS